ncbi:hypothetical protein BGC07_17810 [Piscirickettsia litoralis]|uniref:Uncharacterized protein n=1 Tax=Piscirickettsia litoralis TaxID=1891921 RepID=A0ABX2ZY53_9GAMM|nr:hypothetical protein BGC07_17810 [Piscirickettsia litoralis]
MFGWSERLIEERVSYVRLHHASLCLKELAEQWKLGQYGVFAFLCAYDLPFLPYIRNQKIIAKPSKQAATLRLI